MNSVKTVLLLGLLSGILLVGGEALGGSRGLEYGLLLAIGMNFFSYFFSDKLALRSYSAQPLTAEESPEIYGRLAPIVQGLTQKMGLPMPKLWVIPEDSPNAFATGRDPQHASVAVTEGILRLMSDPELEGVLAHEMGHVLHRDILISSVAATIASAITFLSRMAFFFGGSRDDREDRGSALGGIFMMMLAPIAALLIQMAISRTREFDADAASVKYTGSPDPLIHALRKLEMGVERVPMDDASPSTAHLFILNPFRGGLFRMFSTHPSTEERIARLEQMRNPALVSVN
ncbi:MAG: zinc metalloprotease HtpX [Acidobacteriota bacterium]|nr:zinc metalloprotease HtpX [Acidobacteriota bacterium]